MRLARTEQKQVSNNDRMIISRLYEAAKLISNPVLEQFQEPSERVALGMQPTCERTQ